MAIEKNSFKLLSTEFSAHSRETIMSSDDEDIQRLSSAGVGSDDDDDDEFDDCDSGAGSDDFDLLELGDAGEEFCQVGDQTCSISYDLYDLPGLQDVLSLDVWNDVLSEEERFSLAQYLPDMDHEMFLRTLKEIFTGSNFHFGNPVDKLYEMLKGGLCEPRVALYRQGLNFFQKRQHYHMLRKHQNSMVTSLCHMRDAWSSCKGYSAEEKLQILNIMKSQKSMMNEKIEEFESDSSGRESGDVLWGKRIKDWKLEQRMGSHGTNSSMDIHSQKTTLESTTKPTMKGLYSRQHKRAGYNHGAAVQMKDFVGGNEEEVEELFPVSVKKHQNLSREWKLEQRMGSHGTNSSMDIRNKKATLESAAKQTMKGPHFRQNERAGYNHGAAFQMKDQIVGNEEVEELFPVSVMNLSREWKLEQRMGSYGTDSSMDIRRKKTTLDSAAKQTMKGLHSRQNKRAGYNHGASVQLKDHIVGNEEAEERSPFFPGRAQGESYTAEAPPEYGVMNMKRKKGKTGRMPADVNGRLFPIECQSQPLLEKFRGSSAYNGEQGMDRIKGANSFSRNDETESDSSEQIEENCDDNPLMRRKWAYGSSISDKKAGLDYKKTKISKKDKQSNFRGYDGLSSNNSRKTDDYGVHLGMRNLSNYGTRVESKGEMHDVRFLNPLSSGNFEGDSRFGSGRLSSDDDWRQMYRLGRDGYVQGDYDVMPFKDCRGNIMHQYIDPRSNPILYSGEGEYNLHPESSVRDNRVGVRMGKKVQVVESLVDNRFEMSDAQLIGCNSTKKRKVKPDFTYMDDQHDKEYHSDKHLQLIDSDIAKRKGKKKLGIGNETLEKETVELPVADLGVGDVELDTKPQKKPFILITPTVHTGFSFSIIHLLSSVRMAMVTFLPEDSLDASSLQAKIDEKSVEKESKDLTTEVTSEVGALADENASNPAPLASDNVPFLTVAEIVSRVKSNPGDPCILETQEPLQDLVRGALKILSSKTAPLGAKGWKPLVLYEKTRKSWTWSTPVNQNPADEDVEEVTSPEAWGLPHKMLVKLVDAFANWLKNGQETLRQIGSLPAPPLSLMQYTLEEKERFKDLRAQKSLSTISPSSEEVRSYFRKEEVLRYSIPDRAFSYTAIDGKKSNVAPLRRCGGKPTSKARDHFMLKRDRPPHITILCLVRDAAARLPGSIGTRADVCTLIRDSQYVVEDVTDAQVNQVVSGALDRLHYERDPCVLFDGERKLWVYLHREKEEEEFEDDGTSSTKKWKRQKKETTEPDQGVTVAYSGPREQSQLDLSSDPNVETSQMDEEKDPQLMSHDDGKDHMQEESKLLCQENSTNDDFDDEPPENDPQ